MAVLYTNNASATLGAAITSTGATTLTVSSSALFPAVTAASGDVFYATLSNGTNLEVVKVTDVTGTTFTIVRGQDGTTARTWAQGDSIELRVTKAMLDGKQNQDADLDAIAALAGTSGLLKKTAANTWALVAAPTGDVVGTTDTQTLSGKTLTALKETKTAPSISAGTLTIDCSAGTVFAVSLNANITTLSFTNVPATGTAFGLTLLFTADGTQRTITWGAAVKWPGGTGPTMTATNGKVDTMVLLTHDGGTTWYAYNAGQNA